MARTSIEQDEPETTDETTPAATGDGMSLTEFLNYNTSTRNNAFLRNWRKTGEVKVWLHRKASFHALWGHAWSRVIVLNDRDTNDEKTVVFTKRFNCLDSYQRFIDPDGWNALVENETARKTPEEAKAIRARLAHRIDDSLVKRARYRDDDTGAREHPPQVCPYCLLLDWVGREIAARRLSWVEPLFKFEADDPAQTVVLHAGGMLGMFNANDLSEGEKKDMRKAGVSAKTAWRQKVAAKCQFLFQVVDDSDPSAGVVKALEAGDLGEKLIKAIKKELRVSGAEKGNPLSNPYPLLWTYDENEPIFNKKYDVTLLTKERPSSAVMAKISGKPLDLTEEIAPHNAMELRMELEAAALVEMPWDRFFGPAERLGLMDATGAAKANGKSSQTDEDEPARVAKPAAKAPPRRAPRAEEPDDDGEPESTPKPAAKPAAKAVPKPAAKPAPKVEEPADDEPDEQCEFCLEPIGIDDLECSSCGTKVKDNGKNIVIASIPCTSCRADVPIAMDEANHTCPGCGAVHELAPTLAEFYDNGGLDGETRLAWTLVEAEAKPARGRRGGRTSKAAPTAETTPEAPPGSDNIPF